MLAADTDQPVAGAYIHFWAAPAWELHRLSGRQQAAAQVSSDPTGRFRLNSPETTGRMEIQAAGFGRWRQFIQLPFHGTSHPIGFRIWPAAVLSGLVSDPTGRPIEGAEIRLSPFEDFGDATQVLTGPDGRYRIEGIEGNRVYRLGIRHENFESLWLGPLWLPRGQEQSGMDALLVQASLAEGKVVDAEGHPLPGLRVVAQNTVVPPSESWPVSVPEPASSKPEDLARAVHAGAQSNPFAFSTAEILQFSMPQATTQADGSFRLGSVKPGEYRLSAWRGAHPAASLENVRIQGQQVSGLILQETSRTDSWIRGTVLSKEGKPVPGVRVAAWPSLDSLRTPQSERTPSPTPQPVDGGRTRTRRRFYPPPDTTVTTGADGTYAIRVPSPGIYQVATGWHRNHLQERRVEAPASRIDFTEPPWTQFQGQVLTAEPAVPVPHFRLAFCIPAQFCDLSASQTVHSKENGQFQVENPLVGRFDLKIWAEGHQVQRLEDLDSESTEVQHLQLLRQPRLLAQVQDSEGKPMTGAVVRVLQGQAENCQSTGLRELSLLRFTDLQGNIVLDCLAPGLVQLSIQAPNHLAAQPSFILTAGQSFQAGSIQLTRGHSVRGQLMKRGGQPSTTAVVHIDPQHFAATDWDGRFELKNLPPGHHTLQIRRQNDLAEILHTLDIDVQGDLDLGTIQTSR